MHRLVDLAPQHLRDHDVADQLDRAARRAGRRADDRDAEQDDRGERRPLREVVARKPVVVIIDTVLKTPWRTASSPASTSWLSSATTTTADDSATSASPMRNSSSRANSRSCRP